MKFSVIVADSSHHIYADAVCKMMSDAAKVRGTGIAKRTPEYIRNKMAEGKSVIALSDEKVVGFCYIESWEGHKYVANSGLIVHPDSRRTGLAKAIKKKAFELSREKFPNARLFGITTSMAVMKINSELGYRPVTFSELTKDESFWKGCESCNNYDILQRTNRTMCLCTGMVCDFNNIPPKEPPQAKKTAWENFKQFLQLRTLRLQRKSKQFPKLKKALNDEQ